MGDNIYDKRTKLKEKLRQKDLEEYLKFQLEYLKENNFDYTVHYQNEYFYWMQKAFPMRREDFTHGSLDYQIDVHDFSSNCDAFYLEKLNKTEEEVFNQELQRRFSKQDTLVICQDGGAPDLEISIEAFLTNPNKFVISNTWLVLKDKGYVIEYISKQYVIRFIKQYKKIDFSGMNLSNLEEFSIPLSESPKYDAFVNYLGELFYESAEDQVIALHPKATKYLQDFISTQNYLNGEFVRKQYFKEYEELIATDKTTKEVKKWLYNRGIPFQQKVYWNAGYILSWKMVVKLSNHIFSFDDALLFDASLNWLLRYENDYHNVFAFAKNRIQNAETHSEEIIKITKLIAKGRTNKN